MVKMEYPRRKSTRVSFEYAILLIAISPKLPDGPVIYNMVWHKKEKAQESVLVTRSTLRGLRIAHHRKTSNAEAYADRYIYTPQGTLPPHGEGTPRTITISRRHLPLPCFDDDSRSCEVPKCQKQNAK